MNIKKEHLARLGNEAVEISKQGFYKTASDKKVSIEKEMKNAIEGTILYKTEDLNKMVSKIEPNESYKMKVEVTNETTLDAAKRLKNKGSEKVLVLNFASAKKPGGGFLTGATAQEESLARASGLYQTLISKNEFYKYNESLPKNGLYSDWVIYSPNVPVFRNDKGILLDEAFNLSFITSPAVNAGIARERKVEDKKIHEAMKGRIEKILSIAIEHKYDTLVLGAFGCGVFKNYPKDVVRYFNEILNSDKFKSQFKHITFAVFDPTPAKQNFYVFRNNIKIRG